MKKYFRKSLLFIFLISSGLIFFSQKANADLATTSIASNISSNTTWTGDTIYIIEGSINVNTGVTLTIEPGAVVKFRSRYVCLTVKGILNAQGSATSSVYFTSINDDIGGDTNGTTTPPAAGDWCDIKVISNATTTLDHTIIRYGGSHVGPDYVDSNIYVTGGVLSVSNSVVATSSLYGIRATSGTLTVATTTFNEIGRASCRERV